MARAGIGWRFVLIVLLGAIGAACSDLVDLPTAQPEPDPTTLVNDPSFPDGESESALPDDDGELRLLSVEPQSGPVTGGIDVQITGTGFTDGLEVFFGASPALDVFVVNHSTAIVRLPPHPTGRVDLTIHHPDIDDGQPRTLSAVFRFESPLVVASVTPAEGDRRGGEALTIKGSGFTPDTRFFVGGRLAIVQSWVDEATLTGIAPPGAYGAAPIQVVGFNGIAELPDAYVYRQVPEIATVDPIEGHPDGGSLVRITGAGLDADADIRFGGVRAEVVAHARDGSWLQLVSPPGEAGDVVALTAATSWGMTVASGAWAWLDTERDPMVLSCSTFHPQAGPAAGGQLLTVACGGLSYGVEVRFGDVSAEIDAVDVEAGLVRVVAPPGSGLAEVSVITPFDATILASPYVYEPPPAARIDAVEPGAGLVAGGEQVTIHGSGFDSGALVWFGALPAADVAVLSATTLIAVAPPGPPGLADVVIRQGGDEIVAGDAFDFVPPTTSLDLVAPFTAAQAGGTYLRVYGAGLGADAVVRIGGVDTDIVRRVSSAELHVRSPKLPVGVYDAEIVDGGVVASLPGALTVYDPRSGFGGTWGKPIDETLNVTVRGTSGYGPVAGAFVMVGAEASSAFSGYTDENGQITFSAPGFTGSVDVTASREDFTSYSVVHFDATNLTMYLSLTTPTPDSGAGGGAQPAPPPNATLRGRVIGLDKYVVAPPGSCEGVAIDETEHCASCDPAAGCGGADFACVDLDIQGYRCLGSCETQSDCPAGYACAGSTDGTRCIPSIGEKAAYCNISSTSLFGFEYPIQETGWVGADRTWELDSKRPGDIAVYCFGGYRAADGTFTPTVLGVKRHVFAHYGQLQEGIEVRLEHQLDRSYRLRLMDPPTWPTGLRKPSIVVSLDLGADGVIPFSRDYIDAGDDTWLAPRQLGGLDGNLYDAEFFFYTTLSANVSGGYPRSYNLVQYVTQVVEDRMPVHDGDDWRLEGSRLQADLHGIWGHSAEQIYAVGEDGLILLHNGYDWTQQSSNTNHTLRAVDGSGPRDVWAVGERGAVRHFDGLGWAPVEAPDDSYRAVAVTDSGAVFVAGQIRVRRYEGDGWSIVGPPALQDIHGLAAGPQGSVVAVGSLGRVFFSADGQAWSQWASDTEATLRAVGIDPDSGLVVAVGDEGVVLEGSSTTGMARVDAPSGHTLTALTRTAEGDWVAVGDNGSVLRRDPDGTWTSEVILGYRSKAFGVFSPPEGGTMRVVGSSAFILGPFLHFPVITAPLHEAGLNQTALAWTWTGGLQGQFTRLRVYPEAGASIWTLIVDGGQQLAHLPDIYGAAGFSALGSGQRRLEVTRVLNENFDIDGYTTREFSIFRRDSWSINQSTFYAP